MANQHRKQTRTAEPLREPNGQDSRYLESDTEIRKCFKLFRDQRTILNISLDNTSGSFSHQTMTCRVLDISDTDFLIEDINPRAALSDLRTKPTFTLSVRGQGMFAFIEKMHISDVGVERNLPYFHVPLPKKMLYQQRRKGARFRLPLLVTAAGASITLFRDTPSTGRILDISAGGCRAEFDLPLDSPINQDEVVKHCAIALPPRLELTGEGVLRHHKLTKNHTVVCGIELTKMQITDRRRLEQFIQTITRTAQTS